MGFHSLAPNLRRGTYPEMSTIVTLTLAVEASITSISSLMELLVFLFFCCGDLGRLAPLFLLVTSNEPTDIVSTYSSIYTTTGDYFTFIKWWYLLVPL